MEGKGWGLAALAVVVLAVIARAMGKRPSGAPGGQDAPPVDRPPIAGTYGMERVREGLLVVRNTYGTDMAKNVERIFRLETRNFTSGHYNRTGSPGMVAQASGWPYGWSSLRAFADKFPAYNLGPSTMPTVRMVENVQEDGSGGESVRFIVFPDVVPALHFLAYFLKEKGQGPGRWFSTDPALQAGYLAKLVGVSTPIVDSFVPLS